MHLADFFALHPVFSLADAEKALTPPKGRMGLGNRMRHHLKQGRLKLVANGVYAVVPPGASPQRFLPDPFLVAVAVRSDAVFSHHSALELLGAAHSTWNQCTCYTAHRRRPLLLSGATLRFLDPPTPLKAGAWATLGIRQAQRQGRLLHVTGPERTLVEGFHRQALAGGLEELVLSASGFPTMDLDLLEEILRLYDVRNLWAATGWFLERFSETFHVQDAALCRFALQRPRAPHYLERSRRGGTFAPRWNLVLPIVLGNRGEPNEP